MDLMTMPILWAQAPPPAASPGNALAALAVRRWFGSQTLSPSQVMPNLEPLWVFVISIASLFVIVAIIQGPGRAIRQFFDIPGHFALVHASLRRVRRASRLLAFLIAFTVMAWTASQLLSFRLENNRLDLVSLLRTRGGVELSLEHGMLAGLTPLRDVAALGDNVALLVLAAVVIFRATIDPPAMGFRVGSSDIQYAGHFRPRPGWSTIAWGSAALYALYRLVNRGAGGGELPIGQCLMVETLVIPALMLISDGLLLAWVLVELRDAGLDDAGVDRLDPYRVLNLLPGTLLACFVALPSRYIATFVLLASSHVPTSLAASVVGRYVRWQLGAGLAEVQAVSFLVLGVAGVVAWTRGTLGSGLSGYVRMLRFEGARLVVWLIVAGLVAGAFSAAAYFVVLLLPAQAWVLPAADSYAHFATLPVGLITLAALIEMAERSLPVASVAASRGEDGTSLGAEPSFEAVAGVNVSGG